MEFGWKSVLANELLRFFKHIIADELQNKNADWPLTMSYVA